MLQLCPTNKFERKKEFVHEKVETEDNTVKKLRKVFESEVKNEKVNGNKKGRVSKIQNAFDAWMEN